VLGLLLLLLWVSSCQADLHLKLLALQVPQQAQEEGARLALLVMLHVAR
jgi:hypothetical protein